MRQTFVIKVKEKEAELKEAEKDVCYTNFLISLLICFLLNLTVKSMLDQVLFVRVCISFALWLRLLYNKYK